MVAAFNQEKALVGAFSVITNLRMELFQELMTELTTVMVVMQVAVRLFTEDGFLLVGGDLVRDVIRYCTVLYCTVLYCTGAGRGQGRREAGGGARPHQPGDSGRELNQQSVVKYICSRFRCALKKIVDTSTPLPFVVVVNLRRLIHLLNV